MKFHLKSSMLWSTLKRIFEYFRGFGVTLSLIRNEADSPVDILYYETCEAKWSYLRYITLQLKNFQNFPFVYLHCLQTYSSIYVKIWRSYDRFGCYEQVPLKILLLAAVFPIELFFSTWDLENSKNIVNIAWLWGAVQKLRLRKAKKKICC